MGSYLSLFSRDRKYSVYEGILERIECKIRLCDKRATSVTKRRQQMRKWTFSLALSFAAIAMAYIAWLKQTTTTLTGLQHFQRALGALVFPAIFAVIRALVTPAFDFVMHLNKTKKSKLVLQKNHILKELKDSTRFEMISKIIDKYDPEAKAARRAMARPMVDRPVTTGAQGVAGNRGAGTLQQTKQHGSGPSVLSILQATGQALSPMVDRMANMLVDDPAVSNMLRQLYVQKKEAVDRAAALELQLAEAVHRLSKYEDVAEFQVAAGPTEGEWPMWTNGDEERPTTTIQDSDASEGEMEDIREEGDVNQSDNENGTEAEASIEETTVLLDSESQLKARRRKAASDQQ